MSKVFTNSMENESVSFTGTTAHVPYKIKIWVCSLKRNGLTIIFCLFSLCLILFSNTNLVAAKNGLTLWVTAVIPSLFPFFVATELLSYTNIISFLGKLLNPIMRPLFHVPGEAGFAFLMGLISGYPVGAKIVSHFMEQGICTKEEAERMLAFTNNSGPLFIIGTVGITLFGNTQVGILLFITHILACISVGIVLRFFSTSDSKSYNQSFKCEKTFNLLTKNRDRNKISTTSSVSSKSTSAYQMQKKKNVTFSSLGELLGKSIMNSISTILMIGGFVVIFSVLLSILRQSHILDAVSNLFTPIFSFFQVPQECVAPFFSGIIELTNGVSLIANIPLKTISISIILCAFLLGFGGISILLQVFSIVAKNGLSIKTYFYGKLLQGLFAALYTFLALQFLPFLQLNL